MGFFSQREEVLNEDDIFNILSEIDVVVDCETREKVHSLMGKLQDDSIKLIISSIFQKQRKG
ncbi:MAG: hypothetical protein SVO01_06285 [Thermotogota bacterium]|nr:hypothetical protein [Thermotogota bacterium]